MIAMLACLMCVAVQDDVADVHIEQRAVAGEKQMTYFFIDAEKPDDSKQKNLLLILPGGAGSADYHSFCQRIAKYGLPPNYVVAELVAPVWNKDQADNLVWPTKYNMEKDFKFSTEEFMSAVIADVKKSTSVGKTYAMGWSSSGPAVYAAALADKSPLAGAFVAMSIGPRLVPETVTKRFFILHSPDDRLIDITKAEDACDALRRAGAPVKLVKYPGGHGWSGNVYGYISDGINFMEKGWKG